jgi:DNA-directed RNA polymerase subunit RPC12/RpoP
VASNQSGNDIQVAVDKLVDEANELLSETISATRAADERVRAQGADWPDRHRLQVLLQAAEDSREALPHVIVAPWFLAELRATLDVVRRWSAKPSWREIEPSLRDPDHFAHTVLKLHLAEHLESSGHEVQVVPRGATSSPDLRFRALGGSQDLVFVECYRPTALSGKPTRISAKKVEQIVKKAMEKARHQLPSETPGLLAICGYNQSRTDLETLRRALEDRLGPSCRPSLCGVALVTLGVLFRGDGHQWSFSPTISVSFVPNPSYFGAVDVETKVPDHRLPQLIKGTLAAVTTDSLVSGDMSTMFAANACTPPAKKARRALVRELRVIEEPAPLSRSVVHGAGEEVPPLFVGQGNIDYLCGQCRATLAESVWEASIDNVVVECPTCGSYNEFAVGARGGHGRIQLTRGGYNFSGPVRLRRGVSIRGE